MIVIISLFAVVVIYSGIILALGYRYAIRAAFPRPGRTARRRIWPGMQRLTVPVRGNYDLALLYWPNFATKTLIIFSHNYGGSKETLLNHARIVHNMGYSTVLFDYSNHGENKPLRRWSIFPRFADELTQTIEYMRKTGNTPDKIILFAFSLTTIVALHIASKIPLIHEIICDSGPVHNYYDTFSRFCDRVWFKNKPFGSQLSFVLWCRFFFRGPHPKSIASSLKKKRILIIHNDRDAIIPRNSVLAFCDNIQDCEVSVESFPKGPHLTALSVDTDKYIGVLKKFLTGNCLQNTFQEDLQ
jgi:pimeloyl-ACP methyl ester carboxylesterase